MDQRFFDLKHRLDARQIARDEVKRGSQGIRTEPPPLFQAILDIAGDEARADIDAVWGSSRR